MPRNEEEASRTQAQLARPFCARSGVQRPELWLWAINRSLPDNICMGDRFTEDKSLIMRAGAVIDDSCQFANFL